MKKGIEALILSCIIIFTGCSKSAANYYESAQKYLTAGSYERAIEAYQQALKIDPKNIEAYTGLAEAYQKNNQSDLYLSTLETGYKETSDDTIKTSLTAAYSDLKQTYVLSKDDADLINMYLSAISTLPKEEIYYKELAEIYKKNGDMDKCKEILQQGADNTGSTALKKLLNDLNKKKIVSIEHYTNDIKLFYDVYQYDADGKISVVNRYFSQASDELGLVSTYTYDAEGKLVLKENRRPSRSAPVTWTEYKYDAEGKLIQSIDSMNDPDSGMSSSDTNDYDSEGNIVTATSEDGSISYYSYTYDDAGRVATQICKDTKYKFTITTTYEYDETGNLIKETAVDSESSYVDITIYKY